MSNEAGGLGGVVSTDHNVDSHHKGQVESSSNKKCRNCVLLIWHFSWKEMILLNFLLIIFFNTVPQAKFHLPDSLYH